MGVKQSGVQVGQLAAGLLLPAAVVAVGWRGGVAALAALAGVGLLLTPRLVPAAALTEDRAAAVPRGRWRPTPGLWWLLAYAVVMGAASAPVIAFLPLFAQEALGLGLGAAGAAAASIGLVGIASRVLWTRGSERAAGYAPAMQLIAALAAAAVVLLLAATGAGSWLLWPAVALAGISLPGWYAVTLMAGVAEADRAAVGRASGLVLVGYMTGYTLGPVVAGAALDAGGTYAGLWIGCAGLYGAALVLVAAWRRAGGRRLDPHQAA